MIIDWLVICSYQLSKKNTTVYSRAVKEIVLVFVYDLLCHFSMIRTIWILSFYAKIGITIFGLFTDKIVDKSSTETHESLRGQF